MHRSLIGSPGNNGKSTESYIGGIGKHIHVSNVGSDGLCGLSSQHHGAEKFKDTSNLLQKSHKNGFIY